MAAANTGPKGPENPSAPAVAGGPSAGDLALEFSAADVASLTYISEGEMLRRYECTDPEAIGRVVGALARIELGEPTELVALDAGDLTQALGLVRESPVEGGGAMTRQPGKKGRERHGLQRVLRLTRRRPARQENPTSGRRLASGGAVR